MNDERYAFLASGFIQQEIEKKYELTIPNEIKRLISDIVRQMASFRFNICTTDADVIKDDGKIFKVSDETSIFVSAGDSYGRRRGSCTIKLKTGLIHYGVGFGITSAVSNITSDKHIYLWSENGHTYFAYCNGRGKIAGDPGAQFTGSSWRLGDKIQMEWDDVGNLTFKRNNSEMGRIDIEKGLTYYLCVCSETSKNIGLEIM